MQANKPAKIDISTPGQAGPTIDYARATAVAVDSAEALAQELERALMHKGPYLIEAIMALGTRARSTSLSELGALRAELDSLFDRG